MGAYVDGEWRLSTQKGPEIRVSRNTKSRCRAVKQACTLQSEPIHLPLGQYVSAHDLPHHIQMAKHMPWARTWTENGVSAPKKGQKSECPETQKAAAGQ